MLEAAWWGFVGGGALLVGALLGIFLPTPAKVVGLVMAFGAGVLISALSFELTREAYDGAGGTTVVLGLLAGALVFFAGDWFIDRRGGAPQEPDRPSGGCRRHGARAGRSPRRHPRERGDRA